MQKKISQNNAFATLKIDTLKVNEPLVFNVFIKKENDYVIIIEAGTLLTEDLLHKLQNQERLYVNKRDVNKSEVNVRELKTLR